MNEMLLFWHLVKKFWFFLASWKTLKAIIDWKKPTNLWLLTWKSSKIRTITRVPLFFSGKIFNVMSPQPRHLSKSQWSSPKPKRRVCFVSPTFVTLHHEKSQVTHRNYPILLCKVWSWNNVEFFNIKTHGCVCVCLPDIFNT